MQDGFCGSGWRFPLGVGADGRVATCAGAVRVEQALRLIVGSALGEHPFRPGFGCALSDLLDEPADATAMAAAATAVREAIVRWEPRVAHVDVRVALEPAGARPGLVVHVAYRLSGTDAVRNAVFVARSGGAA